MTAADHDRLRELTAAYVLGALGAEERAEIEDHLEHCDACRQDVVDFAPLPALLGRVGADDLAPPADDAATTSADALVGAVRDDLRRLRRSRVAWRWGAGVAAAAALVLGVLFLTDADDASTRRSEGVVLAVDASTPALDAAVVADQRAWGTYVHVSAAGLPDRDVYEVWTVDAAGAWESVGSWARTADGRAELGCSTSLTLAEIDRIVITSEDRADELLVAR